MWRFRRSLQVGPIRLTSTGRGLAASVKTLFGRVSLNRSGRVNVTRSIPGTGLYQTTTVADLTMSSETSEQIDLPSEDLPAR